MYKKDTTSRICICLALFLLWGCEAQKSNLHDLMDVYAQKGHSKNLKSPFSGVVLVAKNGQVVFREAYGWSDREQLKKTEVTDKFFIGSVTKQFTAMLVMQQVQSGTINLDDPIDKYLDNFSANFRKSITVHHLLSHTSGLPHYEGIQNLGYNSQTFLPESFTPQELVDLISQTKLIHPPGTRYHYSSLGYMLLGAILERVTGLSYSALLQAYITEPLGLGNTGFGNDEYVAKEVVKGYEYEESYGLDWWVDKYGGKIKEAPFRAQSNKYATGGMHATADDLLRWTEALRNGSLLDAAHMKRLLQPNLDGYCYGLQRNWSDLIERNTQIQLYSHGGALNGFRSFIGLFDDGTTIIVLANISPLNDKELIHRLYLASQGQNEAAELKGYPEWNSVKEFERNGGFQALNTYFDRLGQLCGYRVKPSERSLALIMSKYLDEGDIMVADSLKKVLFDDYQASIGLINDMGYYLLRMDQCNYARQFFQYNLTRDSTSANSWDSMGDGLKECGKFNQARRAYERAVAIAKHTRDPNLDIYESNLRSLD